MTISPCQPPGFPRGTNLNCVVFQAYFDILRDRRSYNKLDPELLTANVPHTALLIGYYRTEHVLPFWYIAWYIGTESVIVYRVSQPHHAIPITRFLFSP
ncbi:hypothetical protein J6590_023411 [Homalodisca vitripennis]|nr:hypothetical protein J6590_023411 [Homalodisca vitripennis]